MIPRPFACQEGAGHRADIVPQLAQAPLIVIVPTAEPVTRSRLEPRVGQEL